MDELYLKGLTERETPLLKGDIKVRIKIAARLKYRIRTNTGANKQERIA